MDKKLLSEMLAHNRYMCSFSFKKLTPDNVEFRLNSQTSSAGFIYRHLGEIMHLLATFLDEPTNVTNTTMGHSDTGQGRDLDESHTLVNDGFEVITSIINKRDPDWWLQETDTPFFGKIARIRLFSHILGHNTYHAGQIGLTMKRGKGMNSEF